MKNITTLCIVIFQLGLALIAGILGVVGAAGALINANSISSLSTDQDSICSAVSNHLSIWYSKHLTNGNVILFLFYVIICLIFQAKGIGSTTFTALTSTAVTGLNDAATASTAGTQLQAIITQLNAIATPDC